MGGIRYGLGHLDALDCTFSVFRGVVTWWHSGPPKKWTLVFNAGQMCLVPVSELGHSKNKLGHGGSN